MLLLLCAVTGMAYANAVHDAFVFDDLFSVPSAAALDLRSMLRLFQESFWAATGKQTDVYRPLLQLSLAAERGLHGMQPQWFHLTNVLLHVAATAALFELLRQLLRDTQVAAAEHASGREEGLVPSFLAALIFGLHPIHTEVVNSVFNRSEILATLGVLGAIWIVWRHEKTHPVRAWAGAALLYLGALLCRESAAGLPALVLIVVAPLRPELVLTAAGRRRLVPMLLLLIVAGVYLLVRRAALSPAAGSSAPFLGLGVIVLLLCALISLPAAGLRRLVPVLLLAAAAGGLLLVRRSTASTGWLLDTMTSLRGLDWSYRFGHAASMMREGLRFLVWPQPLRASYADLGAGGELHALAIHALIIGSAALARRSVPGGLLGLGFYYLALLPSTRLLGNYVSGTLAERYMYLPSVGVSLALGLFLRQFMLTSDTRKLFSLVATVALAALFFSQTFARNPDWSSDVALWEAEARVAPDNDETWRLLIFAYCQSGRASDAARVCDARLPGNSRSPALHTNCGAAYERVLRLKEAEAAYRRAIEFGYGAPGHGNLASLLAATNRPKEAEAESLLAIETEVDLAMQHYRRGQYLQLFHPERLAEAESEYRRALELQPRLRGARAALNGLAAQRTH